MGTHIHPGHDILEEFKKLLKIAGLPDIRFHDLRHSAATMLLGMGVHPKIIQERLGHHDRYDIGYVFSSATDHARGGDETASRGLESSVATFC